MTTIVAVESTIGILGIAYFKLLLRHWARDFVFLVLFALTGLDAITRAALGLDYPKPFGFWCGFLLALMRFDKRGRLLPLDENEATE